MSASENQIVVYQPNETVRLDVRLENETVWLTGECCQCENVAVTTPCGGLRPIGKQTRRAKRVPSNQSQFPIGEAA